MKKIFFALSIVLLVSICILASEGSKSNIALKVAKGFKVKNVVIASNGVGDTLSFTVVNNSKKALPKGEVSFQANSSNMSLGGGKTYDLDLKPNEQRDFKIRLNHSLANTAIALTFSTNVGTYCEGKQTSAENNCSDKGGVCSFTCSDSGSTYSYKCCKGGNDDFDIEW